MNNTDDAVTSATASVLEHWDLLTEEDRRVVSDIIRDTFARLEPVEQTAMRLLARRGAGNSRALARLLAIINNDNATNERTTQ